MKLLEEVNGRGEHAGTQCARIVETLHWAHLSTGDLLRDEVKKGTELGKQLEADMKEGKMVPLVSISHPFRHKIYIIRISPIHTKSQ